MQYETDTKYNPDDFFPVWVSIENNTFELTFEQAESFRQFNCFFKDKVFDSISMDT